MIHHQSDMLSDGPCIEAYHCRRGHITGGRRRPIIMASMATTTASISTDRRPHDIADSIVDRWECRDRNGNLARPKWEFSETEMGI
eukprot:scaffold9984_cov148-Skeletonema_dohrnii-CCMP3373.AAC.14